MPCSSALQVGGRTLLEGAADGAIIDARVLRAALVAILEHLEGALGAREVVLGVRLGVDVVVLVAWEVLLDPAHALCSDTARARRRRGERRRQQRERHDDTRACACTAGRPASGGARERVGRSVYSSAAALAWHETAAVRATRALQRHVMF